VKDIAPGCWVDVGKTWMIDAGFAKRNNILFDTVLYILIFTRPVLSDLTIVSLKAYILPNPAKPENI
jgi:hypothetical protein